MVSSRPPRRNWVPTVSTVPAVGESRRSYLIRSCDNNGWPSLDHFLRQIGPTIDAFRRADSNQLSTWFGRPMSEMERIGDRWLTNQVEIDQHVLSTRRFSTAKRAICPDCLAGKGRIAPPWWELDIFTECPEHGPLIHLCTCGTPLSWKDRQLDRCFKCDQDGAVQHPERVPRAKAFERYCLSRLDVAPAVSCPMLDEMDLGRAIDLVEGIGLLMSTGYLPVVPQMPIEKAVASDLREASFAAIREERLPEVLAPTISQFRYETTTLTPKSPISALGWFERQFLALFRSAATFTDTLHASLSAGLGYPVTDLLRTDFMELNWVLRLTGTTERELMERLHELRRLSSCHRAHGTLFVPAELLTLLRPTADARSSRGQWTSAGRHLV